jgi:hypothetical protein
VLQTTNSACAGGESRSGKKIPRPHGHAGSIPASGTNPEPPLFTQGRPIHVRQAKSMDKIRAAAFRLFGGVGAETWAGLVGTVFPEFNRPRRSGARGRNPSRRKAPGGAARSAARTRPGVPRWRTAVGYRRGQGDEVRERRLNRQRPLRWRRPHASEARSGRNR